MSLLLSGTNGLSDVDGSASTPAVRGTDTNTGIFFPAADTIAFAEGGAEVARFDSSGNLGIGTSSPASLLDVRGTSNGQNVLQLSNSAGSSDGGAENQLRVTCNGNTNWGNLDIQAYTTIFTQNGSERMRIDSSGNLLIGTTAPAGIEKVSIVFDNSSKVGTSYRCSSGTYTWAAINFLNASSSQVGYIYPNSTSTQYSTSSDYRLKENIAPMTGALAKVQALKPCTYTWKSTGESDEGFIAHELAEVCPSAVNGEKDAVDAEGNPVYQGIDTSFLVATLTAAIQEQQAIITEQASTITALEARLTALEQA